MSITIVGSLCVQSHNGTPSRWRTRLKFWKKWRTLGFTTFKWKYQLNRSGSSRDKRAPGEWFQDSKDRAGSRKRELASYRGPVLLKSWRQWGLEETLDLETERSRVTVGRATSMGQRRGSPVTEVPGEKRVPRSQREGAVSPLKEVSLALFWLLYKDTYIPGRERGERSTVLDSCQVSVCTGIARGFALKCRCWHHLQASDSVCLGTRYQHF